MTYLFGLFIVSIYWFSFKYETKNISIAIFLLILAGMFLRIYMSLDISLHPWDERYHALVAKNMLLHPLKPTLYENPILPYDYRTWGSSHIWVHKQPVTLWGIALSLWLFGVSAFAVRIPSILLSSLGIFLMYEIGKKFYNQKIGFIAAFLYSIHGMIIEKSSGRAATDHVDLFFLVFVQLAIYFAIVFAEKKKWVFNIFTGVAVGMAILVKWLPALIVLPIWILLLIDSKRFTWKEILAHFTVLVITILSVFMPWQIFILNHYPLEASFEYSFNAKHIFTVLEEHDGSIFYHFDYMRIIFGELIYLPMGWFVYKTYKKYSPKRLIVLIWIFVPYLFFSVVKTKMPGYILFTAPAIFIIISLFWNYLAFNKNRFSYPKLISVIMFLLLALPVRYGLERMKYFTPIERNPKWSQEIFLLKKVIDDENIVVFNTEHPIETMFHTNFVAYNKIPTQSEITNLKKKNYKIYIINNENQQNKIASLKGVTIIHFKNNQIEKITQ